MKMLTVIKGHLKTTSLINLHGYTTIPDLPIDI